MTVQKIRKELDLLDKSSSDYKGSAAFRSGEQRTSEFVGEIQARIDNDPSKLIKSLARAMGES